MAAMRKFVLQYVVSACYRRAKASKVEFVLLGDSELLSVGKWSLEFGYSEEVCPSVDRLSLLQVC